MFDSLCNLCTTTSTSFGKMQASTHGGGGGGGAGAGAGAGAGFGLEPASPPAASSVTLPIVSAHGGLSGSKYDRVVAKPLAQEADNLGSTVAAMLDNRSLQRAINKELLQFSRKQSLRSTAKKHAKTRYVAGTQSAAQPKKPAPNRIVLDEEHVSTLRTIFSLLDTGNTYTCMESVLTCSPPPTPPPTFLLWSSFCASDMDGELTDNQLRTAVTAVGELQQCCVVYTTHTHAHILTPLCRASSSGIPPTRRFLKELRRLVPAGHGVDFETVVQMCMVWLWA